MNTLAHGSTILSKDWADSEPQPSTMATTISMADSRAQSEWNDINQTLIEWANNPRQFDDIDPPSPLAIYRASAFAMQQIQQGTMIPPNWVSPSGDGGINFRWGEVGRKLYTINFEADGRVNLTVTENCKTVMQTIVI